MTLFVVVCHYHASSIAVEQLKSGTVVFSSALDAAWQGLWPGLWCLGAACRLQVVLPAVVTAAAATTHSAKNKASQCMPCQSAFDAFYAADAMYCITHVQ